VTLSLKLAGILDTPWAIRPETLLTLGAAGIAASGDRRAAAVQKRPAQVFGKYGFVSVIPIFGVITYRESLRQQIFGGTSIERLKEQFRRALSDRSVRAIIFDVDSPGGEVAGIPELADEIFRSRATKKTIAVANPEALAGAYWLASAAEEFVVTESGQVGSVGVVAAHEDHSVALEKAGIRVTLIKAGRFKTDGNPFEPLANSCRDDMRLKVDAVYQMFVGNVARARRVKASTVRENFGEGRSVLARHAVVAGMADRVGTLDQTIARLTSGSNETRSRAPAASVPISLLRRELDLISRLRP
jgi:signal peptide peptidase SppA